MTEKMGAFAKFCSIWYPCMAVTCLLYALLNLCRSKLLKKSYPPVIINKISENNDQLLAERGLCNKKHPLIVMHHVPLEHRKQNAEKVVCSFCRKWKRAADGIWHCDSGNKECQTIICGACKDLKWKPNLLEIKPQLQLDEEEKVEACPPGIKKVHKGKIGRHFMGGLPGMISCEQTDEWKA